MRTARDQKPFSIISCTKILQLHLQERDSHSQKSFEMWNEYKMSPIQQLGWSDSLSPHHMAIISSLSLLPIIFYWSWTKCNIEWHYIRCPLHDKPITTHLNPSCFQDHFLAINPTSNLNLRHLFRALGRFTRDHLKTIWSVLKPQSSSELGARLTS